MRVHGSVHNLPDVSATVSGAPTASDVFSSSLLHASISV